MAHNRKGWKIGAERYIKKAISWKQAGEKYIYVELNQGIHGRKRVETYLWFCDVEFGLLV